MYGLNELLVYNFDIMKKELASLLEIKSIQTILGTIRKTVVIRIVIYIDWNKWHKFMESPSLAYFEIGDK